MNGALREGNGLAKCKIKRYNLDLFKEGENECHSQGT
jgi:hypothetical protein